MTEYIIPPKLILGALITSCTTFLSPGGAFANTEPLDIGVYGYLGLGIGYGDDLGTPPSEYIKNNHPQLEIKPHPYVSYNLGFIWKRKINPGWQSMFQLSYRPLDFSVLSTNTRHIYNRRTLSLDFLESYGYINHFSPYIGISWSFFEVQFGEREDSQPNENRASKSFNTLGFIGGWDFLAGPSQRWRFRSNFRWYTDVSLNYQGQRVAFSNFEFEPIQVIFRF